MKRWCICRVGEYEEAGVRMPKVGLYTEKRKTYPHPTKEWALCRFGIADLTPVQADPDIYLIPDGALDMTISNIPIAQRNALKNWLEARGFVFTDVKTSWTVRQLINYLAGQLQPGIDATLFDVSDE